MTWPRALLYVYGMINITGGVIGYFKGNSMMSLIVGGSFGLVILYLATIAKTKPGVGFRAAAVLTVGLGVFWGMRMMNLQNEGKSTMMAMMNLGLAIGVFALLTLAHLMASGKRRAESA